MSKTWRLAEEKKYSPDCKRWYCWSCDKRTPLERNPQWNGEFSGEYPVPDWFVRCAMCKGKHWASAGYDCPNCGCDIDEQEALEYTDAIYNYGAAMEFGGNPIDWDEKHRCRKCGTIYWVRNSNY